MRRFFPGKWYLIILFLSPDTVFSDLINIFKSTFSSSFYLLDFFLLLQHTDVFVKEIFAFIAT